jgi:hypothetical protein
VEHLVLGINLRMSYLTIIENNWGEDKMKRRLFLVLFWGIFVFTAQIAWAAEPGILEIQVDNVTVKENETYITNQSLVDIDIEYNNAVTVKLGSIEKSVTESVYNNFISFNNYSLKTGVNKLTVQAKSSDGKTKKMAFNINYVSTFVPGPRYVTEIPASGKISVFDKEINLTFPKSTFIVDEDDNIINNQKIIFTVDSLKPNEYPSKFRTPVSNIIEIEADGSDAEYFSKAGNIEIKFGDHVPDFSTGTITIMYKNGSNWKNIGAVVNGKNKTATAAFQGFGRYGVFNASRFFEDYNWAKIYAEPLWSKGIMQIRDNSGDIVEERMSEDRSNLGLKNECRRVDFASMIVRAFGYTPVERPTASYSRFDDLGGLDKEDKEDIETAAAYGIVEGVKVDKFDPYGFLNREQAATIIARAMNLSLKTDEAKVNSELSQIFMDEDDFKDISEWAKPYVLACVEEGYINGIPDGDSGVVFNAKDRLKRGEAAKLIYLVMKEKKRI